MRYELRVNAYDALDEVWVSATLLSTEPASPELARVVHHFLTTVRGTGETDPRLWTRDALLALLEEV